ncbi:MAG TPA: MupA/Atu3671 family FMN-dependent luciferase-like monooxygenase, partial [Thermoanaerobaculia bacterium]|nr:MupA/Atu3671 family FMN-dependent luciferase-like monooxygenase [Thermoanaerobaculia bacterium]
LDFSLFYFAAEAVGERGPRYRLLLEGARFADAHGFRAVWTPERHFHSFGGLYPNPSVTGAALAAATSRVGIRAGSVVLPLHDPIRVAEEWSVVDNLSNGRAGVSFASGWHARDFALAPERYADRKDAMLRGIDVVRRLWRGESVPARSGDGGEISVALMPPPVQKELPFWLTAAGNVETFRAAGTLGANLLTNLLGQDAGELAAKIAAYREAWRVSGHRGEGVVTLMVHAFLGDDEARVKEAVRGPFSKYLAASFDLIKMAPTAFPAFRQPSRAGSGGFDPARVTDEDREALVAHAFSRYVEASGLFGTPRSCRDRAEALRETGVDEVACLVDFGVATDEVLAGLERLDALRAACASETAAEPLDFSLAAQVRRHGVTHAQVTPSLARLLLADPSARAALSRLSVLLVGGEALPLALARELAALVPGRVMNMYGPTETTVWSSAAEIERPVESVTLGCPIANTRLEVLDATLEPAPVGVVGELAIGGDGLARGYLDDPDTTATRFVEHPELGRLYRTGDLASRRPDGSVLFHGRADDQVKLAGHRVELGEIEAVLLGVPGVGAAAAAVREDDSGSPRLVAYLVPKSAAAAHDATSRWRAVWDETYRTRSGGAGPLLSGWRSAVTDAPIPLAEMEEWVETTVARVRALLRGSVRRVLEIGCGAGLLLERLAPECEVYEATDVSEEALAIVRERLALAGVPIPSVRLARRPAHDFASVARGAFDLVILNSVAQYFPDSEYLVRVLSGAAAALAPGGAVFLGDVKSLPHQRLLAFEAELARAPASLEAARLAERAAAREARGAELALDPAFLGALPRRLPGLVGATALLKRGRAANELTRYRYDVVLRFGGARPDAPLAQAVRSPERADAHAIARLLGDAPAALCVTDIPNPRHAREILAAELAAKGSGTAGDVRAAAAELPRAGVGPEDLLALDVPYDVTLAFAASGAPDRYDALFRRRDGRGAGESLEPLPLPPESKPLQSCASRPSSGDGLEAAALAALRERLPAPLVPSAVVVLPRLPLTPNGKLDRKALPAPEPRREDTAAGAPPEGEVEERIAAVWRDLLGVSEVARDVNFFDLGANSLLMLEATGRLAAALSRETSLVEMFRFPSVKALAEHFGRSDAQNDGDEAGAVAKSQARGERRREARERRASATPTAASTEVRA